MTFLSPSAIDWVHLRREFTPVNILVMCLTLAGTSWVMQTPVVVGGIERLLKTTPLVSTLIDCERYRRQVFYRAWPTYVFTFTDGLSCEFHEKEVKRAAAQAFFANQLKFD